MDNYIITVGRQLGSGGRIIAERLARELGIGFYDRKLITLASQQSGLGREFFERADEHPSRFLGGFLASWIPWWGGGNSNTCLANDSLFKIQSDVIRHLAEEQSAVFVGRCADYILRDHPRRVDLFVSAGRRDRIERLAERHGISHARAEELIDRGDEQRASYYNFYTEKRWGAAASYDLCIDSSVLGIDATVAFLREFVARKLGV